MAEIMVKSLQKAIRLLSYFDAMHPEWGISELAKEAGLPKSTIFNILNTFEANDMLQKDAETGKYSLGIKVYEMGNVYLVSHSIFETIQKYMKRLSDQVEEKVHLARLSNYSVTYIFSAYPRSYQNSSIAGYQTDIHSTAIGKVLLAYSDVNFVESYISDFFSEGVKACTEYTITKEGTLRLELMRIRERGYALDNNEHEYGIRCVAVPIRNRMGQVIYGMSISAPSPRMDDRRALELAEELRETADEISRRI